MFNQLKETSIKELKDRGIDLSKLTPEQRKKMEQFMKWIEKLDDTNRELQELTDKL